MLLTTDQLKRIKQIIDDAHHAVIVNYISPEAVPQDILERLKRLGLVNVQTSVIEDAYLLGHVLQGLEAAQAQLDAQRGSDKPLAHQGKTPPVPGRPKDAVRVAGRPGDGTPVIKNPDNSQMTYAQLLQYVRKQPVQLSDGEQQAIKMANMRSAQYVVGLGNRVSQQTGNLMIEADADLRQQFRDVIRTQTERNIAARQTVQRLRSDLGHATGDWSRDLDRIAVTEKQTAMQEGFAAALAQRSGGEARVAKLVSRSGCPQCRLHYLMPDGRPRIFKLSELEANGSNYGRKVAQLKPTVGPLHPRCLCTLVSVPPNYAFDGSGNLVPEEDAQKSQASNASGLRKAFLPKIELKLWPEEHLEDCLCGPLKPSEAEKEPASASWPKRQAVYLGKAVF
jgi:hypothetical protein